MSPPISTTTTTTGTTTANTGSFGVSVGVEEGGTVVEVTACEVITAVVACDTVVWVLGLVGPEAPVVDTVVSSALPGVLGWPTGA